MGTTLSANLPACVTAAACLLYEAVSMLAATLRKGSDPVRLRDAVIGIGKFNGLPGDLIIDRYGDPDRKFSVMRVRDERFVLAE